jgi:hypothetical protein
VKAEEATDPEEKQRNVERGECFTIAKAHSSYLSFAAILPSPPLPSVLGRQNTGRREPILV